MTDPEKPSLNDLLSSFALGPAWARSSGNDPKARAPKDGGEREARRDDRGDRGDRRDGRGGQRRDDRRDGGFNKDRFKGKGGGFEQRPFQDTPPAEGVRVTLVPSPDAIHLIAKEIQQVARVYPLFDVAQTLLAERSRCHVVFERLENHSPFLRGKLDGSLFLTREEATHHLWNSALKAQFIDEETIEVDPPSGNFQVVAKCGLSGDWLGPPNFHAYQTNLRRVHRERFSHLPFEAYAAKVRTERGEEAVNAWLETMKTKVRWRLKGQEDDSAWIDDQAQAERTLATQCFDQAFEEARRVELPGSLDVRIISPGIKVSLKLSANHAKRHPAMLIPAVCKALEAQHLPVFKRKGKLYTGPVRPHPLPVGVTLAPRPAQMVDWIRANPPAKLEGLWKAVLPEGSTAPPADYAADLFWLLHQGHILLFTDDTLVVQEHREAAPAAESPAAGAKKKKKKKNSAGKTDAPSSGEPQATAGASETEAEEAGDEASAEDESTEAEAVVEPETVTEAEAADEVVVDEAPPVEATEEEAPPST